MEVITANDAAVTAAEVLSFAAWPSVLPVEAGGGLPFSVEDEAVVVEDEGYGCSATTSAVATDDVGEDENSEDDEEDSTRWISPQPVMVVVRWWWSTAPLAVGEGVWGVVAAVEEEEEDDDDGTVGWVSVVVNICGRKMLSDIAETSRSDSNAKAGGEGVV